MAKKSDANTKAKHTATLATLGKDAKAINASFVKVAKLDGQANDNRLIAAVRIAAVKATCDKAKINFKKWCEESITEQGYETVRKLAMVGASDNPAEALAALRDNNKQANKAARERATTSTPSKDSEPRGNTISAPTDFDCAVEAVSKLNETGQIELCRSILAGHGFAAIKKLDLEKLHAHANATPTPQFKHTPQPIGDIGDIPAALKRTRKTSKRASKRKTTRKAA